MLGRSSWVRRYLQDGLGLETKWRYQIEGVKGVQRELAKIEEKNRQRLESAKGRAGLFSLWKEGRRVGQESSCLLHEVELAFDTTSR